MTESILAASDDELRLAFSRKCIKMTKTELHQSKVMVYYDGIISFNQQTPFRKE